MITLVLLAAALALSGYCYTLFRTRQLAARLQPDGQFAQIDGIKVHYHYYPLSREAGKGEADAGPVLVFVHGASGNAYDARMAFLDRVKGRYSVLFADRPGLGFSEAIPGRHDVPAGQAKVLAGLLDYLCISSAIVIGHSYGGAVTAALGLLAPDRVKGLAFLAPVSHVWPGGVTWYYSLASWPVIGPLFSWVLVVPAGERLAGRSMDNVFFPDPAPKTYAQEIRLPLLFRPASFQANARQIARLKGVIAEQSKRYTSLTQPALVVTGTEDTVVWPSIHCEGLIRDLPNARLLMLDRAGHMPHHTHGETIVSALEELVAAVVSEASGGKAPAGAAQGPIPSERARKVPEKT